MANRLAEFSWFAMGGPCKVSVWLAESDDGKALYSCLQAEVERLEDRYSRYRSHSWLSRLNRGEPVDFDLEVTGLLNYLDNCHDLSEGLFDPTVGVLRKHWNFNQNRLPDSSSVVESLAFVGWGKLNWNGARLSLPEGMELDFGGLVKEFATDRLAVILAEQGYLGLVNLAGDIAVSGTQPNGEPWLVAIKHPRNEGAFAKIPLMSGALATSGDYERYLTVNSRRYCHILRPDTGFSAADSLASATVLADSCTMAGTVATIAMLKGTQGLNWLAEMKLPYFAITSSLQFHSSKKV